jgi:hypothetical protein
MSMRWRAQVRPLRVGAGQGVRLALSRQANRARWGTLRRVRCGFRAANLTWRFTINYVVAEQNT